MQTAIDQLRANIENARNLGRLYSALSLQVTSALDLSDILRAELVFAVSALDQYVHELVRLGIIEIYTNKRPQTQTFLRFSVTLESTLIAISAPTNVGWLDNQVRLRHGYQSFQHPDKIADAVRLISDVPLWPEVAKKLNSTTIGLKTKLTVIVDRRNQIAHEADLDPSFPGKRWPINLSLVEDAVAFILDFSEAIFDVIQ